MYRETSSPRTLKIMPRNLTKLYVHEFGFSSLHLPKVRKLPMGEKEAQGFFIYRGGGGRYIFTSYQLKPEKPCNAKPANICNPLEYNIFTEEKFQALPDNAQCKSSVNIYLLYKNKINLYLFYKLYCFPYCYISFFKSSYLFNIYLTQYNRINVQREYSVEARPFFLASKLALFQSKNRL